MFCKERDVYMLIERLSTDVGFTGVPRNGFEAYNMVIASLSAEIEEKTEILSEMLDENVKRQFIRQWHPGTRNVNIHV